jgi:hypothetical protein
MKSKLRLVMLAFLSLAGTAAAETVSCPDLAAAVQVAPCPPEEELRYTFTGYCGAGARLYGRDADHCADYASYRRLKNVALWESADGAFHTYLSCELPPAEIKAAKAARIAVVKQGKLTQVVCSYRDGVAFTYRTKAACKVEGTADCAGGGCKASCD